MGWLTLYIALFYNPSKCSCPLMQLNYLFSIYKILFHDQGKQYSFESLYENNTKC